MGCRATRNICTTSFTVPETDRHKRLLKLPSSMQFLSVLPSTQDFQSPVSQPSHLLELQHCDSCVLLVFIMHQHLAKWVFGLISEE